ncbi:allergin-1-like isoform X2 [Dendrobates tinctorius]|uniref:allergin-1-like isoform X2 n=1 Tax=Dendrobates tinctorius TaxID=92724 RepID=UPI003CC94634
MVPLHLLCVLLFCAVSLSEQLSKTELKTESLYTMIGHTETIHCVCRNGSLPITYMLFINQTTVGKRTVSGEREAAFNVTIYNDTRLGSYKCKANNSQQCSPYSAGFSFTLQERLLQVHLLPGSLNTMIGHSERILCTCGNGSLPISYTLTLNEVTIDQRTVSEEREATFNVTIFDETRLGPYKCKANNSLKYSLYSDEFSFILQGRVDGQEDQFCAVEAMRGTADKNKSVEDQDVTYCDVVIGRGPASIIKKEESVEYMQVSKKSF